MSDDSISQEIIKTWEDNITSRLAKDCLRIWSRSGPNIIEASLPGPKHLIVLEVQEIVDLALYHLKESAHG